MRRKDLSSFERASIIQFLLEDSRDGKPGRGKMQEAVARWSSSRRTISRIWAGARQQQQAGEVINSTSRKISRPRRRRVHIDLDLIASLELTKRSTIRKLACGIQCSKTTVGRWIDQGLIKAHSNAIKPDLTAPNKLLRLRFSLEALEYDRTLNKLTFKSMQNTVYIDEKWFYITKTSHKFYLTPAETEPHRTCKSKKFIKKVIFLCAVARPVFGPNGECEFDGKIGMWSFTEKVPAKRTSKNRSAGTIEMKPIQSITQVVMKDSIITQLIPAIKAKWPHHASKNIYIQQDNARPHIKDDDPDFRAAASSDGFNIRIVHQPPNSPDTNINDLGWFRAIQSLQTESVCTDVTDLVNAVHNSYEELSPVTLNKVFLSLQCCMLEILRVRGQNCYKVPHMGKDALIRQNMLPINLEVPTELVRECMSYLIEKGSLNGSEAIFQQLGIEGNTMDEVEAMMQQLGMHE